jgi:hypothetical protein
MEKKTIKDPLKLIDVMNSLSHMSGRLLFHFLLTQKPGVPFSCTYYNMGIDAKIQHPQRAIGGILKKGYITREQTVKGNYSYVYTLHLDLIE